MINREFQKVEIKKFFDTQDIYGQPRKIYDDFGDDNVVVKYFSGVLAPNPGYEDIDYLVLTKRRDIDSSCFIRMNGKNYRVINVIPSRKFDQLFVRETNENPTKIKYKVTTSVSPEGGGTVSGAGEYTSGTVVTLTATPLTHYEFVEWNDGYKEATRSFKITSDCSYEAIFRDSELRVISLIGEPEGWGDLFGAGAYHNGDEIQISTVADKIVPGQPRRTYFDQWDDGNIQNPRSITVTEDKTYIAYYKIYTAVHASPREQVTGHNWVALKQGTVIDDLTAIPLEGQVFSHWSDGSTANPHESFTVGEEIFEITAYFDNLTLLSTPQNLRYISHPLSYEFDCDDIENAGSYVFNIQRIDGTSIGNYTSYTGSDITILHRVLILPAGTYKCRVKARPSVDDTLHIESQWSEWCEFEIFNEE